jgi:hypothetical protein
MHYEVDDSSGTAVTAVSRWLFDIHQQFDELLPGKLDDPLTTEETACNSDSSAYLCHCEQRLRSFPNRRRRSSVASCLDERIREFDGVRVR